METRRDALLAMHRAGQAQRQAAVSEAFLGLLNPEERRWAALFGEPVVKNAAVFAELRRDVALLRSVLEQDLATATTVLKNWASFPYLRENPFACWREHGMLTTKVVCARGTDTRYAQRERVVLRAVEALKPQAAAGSLPAAELLDHLNFVKKILDKFVAFRQDWTTFCQQPSDSEQQCFEHAFDGEPRRALAILTTSLQ